MNDTRYLLRLLDNARGLGLSVRNARFTAATQFARERSKMLTYTLGMLDSALESRRNTPVQEILA